MVSPRQRLLLTAILIFTFLFFLRYQRPSLIVSTYDTEPSLQVSGVYNGTLGFGQIYCTNLPHRTDRRDAMQLNSIMSGISVEFIDGVYGDKIDNRALIGHLDRNMPDGEKDGTALILEDDLDWDIHLKDTLSKTAEKIREMESERLHTVINDPRLPYGDTWDIIYLGNCYEAAPDDPNTWPHRTYEDPTVPDPEKHSWNVGELFEFFSLKPTGERL
ncbi:Procollagen galactosyltransferase 1-B, partial [Neolecta irregularis DAH-3]